MKAVRVHATGGPEALRYEEAPDPVPQAGQALVRVEAIGVNFIDVYHRTGLYSAGTPPFTLGQEAAGTVVAIHGSADRAPDAHDAPDAHNAHDANAATGHPASHAGIAPGDRVAWSGIQGAYAELAVVPAARLVKLPDRVTTRQGAAAMLQGMTAHYLATSTHPLASGETCLVHAAAGGVGLLLCQIAKLRGARVLATVSTEAKAELARGAGADLVIRYDTQEFAQEVKQATGGRGVEVVYDGVGRATFDQGLRCLAPRGIMVLFGQSSGTVPPVNPALLASHGSLFLTRPTLGSYIATREELAWRAGEVLDWIGSGRLSLRIDRELPLARAADAHRALEARETTGKVLLIP